ncbi:hypothetical protein K461DRAFT_297794 [Myriangium duriaei CBS 260.36]|uniref:Anaphase-promoting complex subunit 4 n=1 Tax=Myriangium duriaei CBS 260.36 TaxID=1168546 RepID=A0A9P4IWX3_9PEZI|nr:hypothetical protein K461DRAFT_297794 [Myriangium duriaei CBS 260.36]
MPDPEPNKTLQVLGEQQISALIRPATFQHENRTDLVAFITESDDVLIHRLGGQLVQRLESDDFSGKPTCDLLLVGTDSGIVDVLGLGLGRLATGRTRTSDPVAVTSVGTHVAHFGAHDVASILGPAAADATSSLTDWLSKVKISGSNQMAAESDVSLPLALAKLDVNDILPKLSPIPTPSKAGPGLPAPVIRSAQKDLHILLNRRTASSADTVEVTFTTFEDGSIDTSIGDLFQRSFAGLAGGGAFFAQCAAPASGVHAMVTRQDLDIGGTEPAAVALDVQLYKVPFSMSESVHTGTILSNAVQLERLEMYINQTVETAALDWNTLTALPGRFIANINETLEEKAEGPLQNHFCQLLLTGYCSEKVTEWLKEDLAERGHKRWDLAMTTFYHSVSHLLEVNLLPAIEKCAVTASTLRGLATYYEGSKNFDVEPQFLTAVIEALGSLHLLAHEALQILSAEQRQFAAFSKWLRIRVDIAASEPGSTTFNELLDSEAASTDVPLVMSYLTDGFIQSRLESMVGRRLPASSLDAKLSSMTFAQDDATNAIVALRKSATCLDDVLYLPLQMRRLQRAVVSCLTQMKRWQSTTWLPATTMQIAFEGPLSALHVRMQDAARRESKSMAIQAIGVDAEQQSRLCVHTLPFSHDPRSLGFKSGAQSNKVLEFPDPHTIYSPKFLPSGNIIALIQTNDSGLKSKSSRSIINIPAGMVGSNEPTSRMPQSELEALVVHKFASDDAFIPHLLQAEREAQKIVQQAREYRTKKVKDARSEAQKEIEEYRKQKEEEFKKFEKEHTSGNKKAEEDADKDLEAKLKEIKQIGEKSGSEVIDQLLRAVSDVRPQVPDRVEQPTA